MKNISLSLLLISCIIISCNNKTSKQDNPIPDAFNEDSKFSYSSRWSSDVIQQLFDEALDENEKLNDLNERILRIEKQKDDSLKMINQYINNNSVYWNSVKNYYSNLTDTVLIMQTKTLFDSLENEYNVRMSGTFNNLDKLRKSTNDLNDQHILLKLNTVKSIMIDYQNKTKPSILVIDQLTKDYDQLIKETEMWIENIK